MQRSNLNIWISTFRPKTLGASIAPICIGASLVGIKNKSEFFCLIVVFFSAICIQISTNLINDFADFEKGVDREDRIGPKRASQSGELSVRQVKQAAIIALVLAAISGLYLVYRGGVLILIIGLVSLLCAALYSSTRFALSHTGLADLAVLLFFGPIAVGGTSYIINPSFNSELLLQVLFLGTAVGSLSTAILVANNLRDRVGDELAGRKTLTIRFGESFSRWQYIACMLAPLPCVGALLLINALAVKHAISLVYLFLAISPLLSVFKGCDGKSLNSVLEKSAKATLAFGLLFALTSFL